jgi:hypothetical protein
MTPQRFISTQKEANEQQSHSLTQIDPEGYIYKNKWLI